MTLDEIYEAYREIGLLDRDNLKLRVKWVNTLREIVARRCPRNKVGSPIVSDTDVILATAEEHEEALNKVRK